jgi:hypothetical protein
VVGATTAFSLRPVAARRRSLRSIVALTFALALPPVAAAAGPRIGAFAPRPPVVARLLPARLVRARAIFLPPAALPLVAGAFVTRAPVAVAPGRPSLGLVPRPLIVPAPLATPLTVVALTLAERPRPSRSLARLVSATFSAPGLLRGIAVWPGGGPVAESRVAPGRPGPRLLGARRPFVQRRRGPPIRLAGRPLGAIPL